MNNSGKIFRLLSCDSDNANFIRRKTKQTKIFPYWIVWKVWKWWWLLDDVSTQLNWKMNFSSSSSISLMIFTYFNKCWLQIFRNKQTTTTKSFHTTAATDDDHHFGNKNHFLINFKLVSHETVKVGNFEEKKILQNQNQKPKKSYHHHHRRQAHRCWKKLLFSTEMMNFKVIFSDEISQTQTDND